MNFVKLLFQNFNLFRLDSTKRNETLKLDSWIEVMVSLLFMNIY